jgi:citrate lyase gamma subunit
MTTKIQLDRDAVMALFPEGSEAQVELRRVVAAALVEKLAVKDVKFLDHEMQHAVRVAVNDACIKYGVREWYAGGTIQVSQRLLDHIQSIVKDQFDRSINDQITKCLDADRLREVEATVVRRLENRLDVLITQGLHDRIREQVRLALKGL